MFETDASAQTGSEEYETDQGAAAGQRGGLSRVLPLLIVVLVIVAGSLATVAISGYLDLRALREGEAAGTAAVAVAKSYAADMLSYDYRSIQNDLAKGSSHATGGLVDYYKQLAVTLVPEATRQRATQQVAVAGAAVEFATPDRVQVLMLLNRTTIKTAAGSAQPAREVTLSRARFVMVRRGDTWLVSELSTLLGNAPATWELRS